MKILDQRGRPVLNSHQAVQKEMAEEGLLEIDLNEMALLDEATSCYDDDIDWTPDLEDEGRDESCKRCGSVICRCDNDPSFLSCYDNDDWGTYLGCPDGIECPVCGGKPKISA